MLEHVTAVCREMCQNVGSILDVNKMADKGLTQCNSRMHFHGENSCSRNKLHEDDCGVIERNDINIKHILNP